MRRTAPETFLFHHIIRRIPNYSIKSSLVRGLLINLLRRSRMRTKKDFRELQLPMEEGTLLGCTFYLRDAARFSK